MSMYTTLLGSALDQSARSDDTDSIGELFAALMGARARLGESGIASPSQARTLAHVTSQLAYDVALVNLARGLGVGFAVERFDNGERHLLEQVLLDRGLPLDGLDERP